jgi:hypothetical protein
MALHYGAVSLALFLHQQCRDVFCHDAQRLVSDAFILFKSVTNEASL